MNQLRDRRTFPRVNYRSYARLSSGGLSAPVHLLDISFKGALVALLHPHQLRDGDAITLYIELETGGAITMQGKLAHHKDHYLGLECQANSIEHKSRLHELVRQQAQRDTSRSIDDILNEFYQNTPD